MKFKPGQMIAEASGKLGGMVFSHNRYGAYCRTLVIPTKSNTVAAVTAKDLLANLSRQWQGLSDAQRATWSTWAATNPITDRLGQKQTLQANSAYQWVNNNVSRAGGTVLMVAPTTGAPAPLTTCTLTASLAGPLGVVFTATPLGAGLCMRLRAAVVNNGAKKYVANLFKEILITPAAATSPVAISAALASRFGTIAIGQQLYIEVTVLSKLNGLMSGPIYLSGAVTA